MTNTKLTQKDLFNATIALLKGEETTITTDDVIEFLEGRIAQLEKKSAKRKTASTSKENIALKEKVLNVLNDGGRMTVTQIMKADAELGELSNQKVTSLLRMLIADDKVAKDKDKKTTLFFIVEE